MKPPAAPATRMARKATTRAVRDGSVGAVSPGSAASASPDAIDPGAIRLGSGVAGVGSASGTASIVPTTTPRDPGGGAPGRARTADRRAAGDGEVNGIATTRGVSFAPVNALVVLPTFNEAENIIEVLDRIRAAAPELEVLVVDDGSPDGTADLAE